MYYNPTVVLGDFVVWKPIRTSGLPTSKGAVTHGFRTLDWVNIVWSTMTTGERMKIVMRICTGTPRFSAVQLWFLIGTRDAKTTSLAAWQRYLRVQGGISWAIGVKNYFSQREKFFFTLMFSSGECDRMASVVCGDQKYWCSCTTTDFSSLFLRLRETPVSCSANFFSFSAARRSCTWSCALNSGENWRSFCGRSSA